MCLQPALAVPSCAVTGLQMVFLWPEIFLKVLLMEILKTDIIANEHSGLEPGLSGEGSFLLFQRNPVWIPAGSSQLQVTPATGESGALF